MENNTNNKARIEIKVIDGDKSVTTSMYLENYLEVKELHGIPLGDDMIQSLIDELKNIQQQMFSTIYNPAIKKPLFKHSRYYKTLSRKSKLLMAELQAYIQYEIDMEILNEGQMTDINELTNILGKIMIVYSC